jgi:NAD(P)H-nitrite reductase large subunit
VLALRRVLDRQLDERGAHFLERFLEGLGLEIQAPAHAVAVVADGRVTEVLLEDGRTLPCDVFVVATGISPNVDVARAAGLEVGRGIVVDDRMQTSDPRIFAAGDAAEHDGLVRGLWPTAVEQARVAATNATGGDVRYESSPPVTSLKVTGVELTSVGRLEPGPDDTSIVVEEPGDARYRMLLLAADGSIAGAILLGRSLEAAGIIEAIKTRRNVMPVLDELRSGDWSAFREQAAPIPVAQG